MKIIFSGVIGRLPVGGHAWIAMQYMAGLCDLGHDIFFLEDCGEESWVYNWDSEQITNDLDYPANYVRYCVEMLELDRQWIYRAGSDSRGASLQEFRDFCSDADLLIIWAVPLSAWRDEYSWPKRRAFIDADPGFTQIRLSKNESPLKDTVDRSERLFTINQRGGAADCIFPDTGRNWIKTLAPISLRHWPVAKDNQVTHFTSVMQWRGFYDVEYQGMVFGQKDREFSKFMDLPRHTTQPFRIALTGTGPEDLTNHGWHILPGWIASKTPASYQSFVQSSRAEFGVAKHGYVQMRGGWFSDRSVCYLSSGRPVLLEDTGLSDWLPVGEGILTFRDRSDALQGIEAINSDYARHCHAARRLAEEYFATECVLPPLLNAAMN